MIWFLLGVWVGGTFFTTMLLTERGDKWYSPFLHALQGSVWPAWIVGFTLRTSTFGLRYYLSWKFSKLSWLVSEGEPW